MGNNGYIRQMNALYVTVSDTLYLNTYLETTLSFYLILIPIRYNYHPEGARYLCISSY
jgi:uncharacterized membrane protein